jgi:phosphoribosylamine--glycine ligase
VDLAQEESVDLVVVGPEIPLCNGLVDDLQKVGILAYGPDAAGAKLEGSKAYTKDFLAKYAIPTAAYGNFSEGAPCLGIPPRLPTSGSGQSEWLGRWEGCSYL